MVVGRVAIAIFLLFVGCRANGEPCDAASWGIDTCGSGLMCYSATHDPFDSPGICMTQCTTNADCSPNHYCATDISGGVCWY